MIYPKARNPNNINDGIFVNILKIHQKQQ